MPTPDRRRPELLASLPELRFRLEQQRTILSDHLATHGGQVGAALQALGDIEVALRRMSTGRYGTCLYCGAELPLDQLLALPQSDACGDCG